MKFTVDVVNKLWTDDIFYFLIGTCISADTLFEEDDYKASYSILIEVLESLQSDECLIPDDERQENIKLVSNSIISVKNEYKEKFDKELV